MIRSAAAIVFSLTILAACGGGGDEIPADAVPAMKQCEFASLYSPIPALNSERVQYSGSDLWVDNVKYPPDALPTANCAKGSLLVVAKPNMIPELTALVESLGLRVDRNFAPMEILAISVPVGYEQQWLVALQAQADVQSADLNHVNSPMAASNQ